jgi:hypothetical protein
MTARTNPAADACAVTLLYKAGQYTYEETCRRLRALGLPDFIKGGVSPRDEIMKAPTVRHMRMIAANYAK